MSRQLCRGCLLFGESVIRVLLYLHREEFYHEQGAFKKNEYLKLLTRDGGHNRESMWDQSSTVCIKE